MRLVHFAPLAMLFAFTGQASADGPDALAQASHSRDSLQHDSFDVTLGAAGATGLASSADGSSNQFRLPAGDAVASVESSLSGTDTATSEEQSRSVHGVRPRIGAGASFVVTQNIDLRASHAPVGTRRSRRNGLALQGERQRRDDRQRIGASLQR